MSSFLGIGRSADAQTIKVGGFPRVDLLPSDVKAGSKLRQRQTSLLVGLVLVVAAVAGAVFWATTYVAQINEELTAEQSRTADLITQQAQYADVPIVTGLVQSAQAAQVVGSISEVLWQPYVGSMSDALGDGTLTTVQTTMGSPVAPYTGAQDVFGGSAIGQVVFTADAGDVANATRFIERLRDLPGTENVAFTSITGVDGGVTITGTIAVGPEALSLRFAAADAEEG